MIRIQPELCQKVQSFGQTPSTLPLIKIRAHAHLAQKTTTMKTTTITQGGLLLLAVFSKILRDAIFLPFASRTISFLLILGIIHSHACQLATSTTHSQLPSTCNRMPQTKLSSMSVAIIQSSITRTQVFHFEFLIVLEEARCILQPSMREMCDVHA